MFDYKDKNFHGIEFFNWDLIQYDLESNLPQFLGKTPEQIQKIIVVGAWQGDEVGSFLNFPKAQIYCFEPNPKTYNILKTLYLGQPRVHCYQNACSSRNEVAVFYETNLTGNGSLLPVDRHRHAQQAESFPVQSIRLDSIAELQDSAIDLIWADVQGFELEVLRGSSGLLDKVDALFLEVSIFGSSYKNATKLSDLEEFLKNYGFYRIAQGLGKDGEGNALFLKTDNAKLLYLSEAAVNERLQVIVEKKIPKRKLYNLWYFKLLHAVTPQPVRTFLKKRLHL